MHPSASEDYENDKKNHYLKKQFGDSVSLEAFIPLVFSPDDEIVIVKKKGNGRCVAVETISDIQRFPSEYFFSESFFSYNTYYESSYSAKNIKNIRALVLDIDGMLSQEKGERHLASCDVVRLTECLRVKRLLPTFINNSGKGVHLIYAISGDALYKNDTPDACLKFRKNIADYLRGEGFYIDLLPQTQAYRIAGTPTKLKNGSIPSCAFLSGKKLTIGQIKKASLKQIVSGKKTKNNEKKDSLNTENAEKISKNPEFILPKRSSKQSIYELLLGFANSSITHIGSRNNLCFALSVAAFKSGVAKSKLASDLLFLAANRMQPAFSSSEAMNATVGYSMRYVKMRWQTMLRYLPAQMIQAMRDSKGQPTGSRVVKIGRQGIRLLSLSKFLLSLQRAKAIARCQPNMSLAATVSKVSHLHVQTVRKIMQMLADKSARLAAASAEEIGPSRTVFLMAATAILLDAVSFFLKPSCKYSYFNDS